MQKGPGQIFVEITEVLKANGGLTGALNDDGLLRRFFNETIKTTLSREERQESERIKTENDRIKQENDDNRYKNMEIREKNKTLPPEQQVKEIETIQEIPEPKSKGRKLHDTISTGMSAHDAELRQLIAKHVKPWSDKVSDTLISDFDNIFTKMTTELKESPEWQNFWEKLDPKPDDMAHAQERILMAYRFKMFQMITQEYKVAKTTEIKDGKEVSKPMYNIREVASLDIVLQKLNGAYDRKKESSLRDQFNKEFQDESGPSYVVDLNMMLAEAIKMKGEGKSKTEIDDYIAKRRLEIRDDLVKKDKYAIHVDRDLALKNFDDWFPLHTKEPDDRIKVKRLGLIERAEAYDQVCAELGFDVNAMVRLMTGLKETQKPSSTTKERELAHEDVLVIEEYIQMLKAKAYIKDYKNSKNEEIYLPFDEEKFQKLQKEVNRIVKGNPVVSSNRSGLLRADLFAAARSGDFNKFRNLVNMGADLTYADMQEGDPVRKTAFQIIFPKLTDTQLKELAKNPDIASQLKDLKQNLDVMDRRALAAAKAGNFEALKLMVSNGIVITKENEKGESILDLAKKNLPKEQFQEIVQMAKAHSTQLDLDNPEQYAIVKAYAKNIHVLEYFDFRDSLEKTQKMTGDARVNAIKNLAKDYIFDLNPNVVALNLDGGGTPEDVIKLRDKLREYKDKLDPLSPADAEKILDLCERLNVKYSDYLIGNQLPHKSSREIISSKYPVHTYLSLYHSYVEGKQSERKNVRDAVLKHADIELKNLDGVTPLQLAARMGDEHLVSHMLDIGAKTTEYKRSTGQAFRDGFKGFPKNLKYLFTTPPRTLEQIQAITPKGYDESEIVKNLIEKEKGKMPKVDTKLPEVKPKEQTVTVSVPEKPQAKVGTTPEVQARVTTDVSLDTRSVQPPLSSVSDEVPVTPPPISPPTVSGLEQMLSQPSSSGPSNVVPFNPLSLTTTSPQFTPHKSIQIDSVEFAKQWIAALKEKASNGFDRIAVGIITDVLNDFMKKGLGNPKVLEEMGRVIDSRTGLIGEKMTEGMKATVSDMKSGQLPVKEGEKVKVESENQQKFVK